MSIKLESVDIAMTVHAFERTWRTVIDTPSDADPADYRVTAYRCVELRTDDGELHRTVMDPVECLLYSPLFKPVRTFTAREAELVTPGITAMNRDGIDAAIAAQKLSEAEKTADTSSENLV